MVLLLERSKLVVEGAGAVGRRGDPPRQGRAARRGRDLRRPLRRQRRRLAPGGVHPPRRDGRRPPHRAGHGGPGPARVRSPALLRCVAEEGANVLDVTHLREGVDLHIRETVIRMVLQTDGREHGERVMRRSAKRLPRPRSRTRRSAASTRRDRVSAAAYEEPARAARRDRRSRRRRGAPASGTRGRRCRARGAEPRAEHLATLARHHPRAHRPPTSSAGSWRASSDGATEQPHESDEAMHGPAGAARLAQGAAGPDRARHRDGVAPSRSPRAPGRRRGRPERTSRRCCRTFASSST